MKRQWFFFFSVHLESSGYGSPKDIRIVPHCILRCPLHCVLPAMRSPKSCFICLCSFTLTCEYQQMSANQGCLWCYCSHAEWGLLIKKYSACWDIQSALFKLLLLGTHEVLVNYSNQPMSRNVPSKQMAATAGSQETTGFFSWRVGVDSISRHKSKWLSALSFLSKGDMSTLIYLWDRLPFTIENLPLIYNWFTLNTCRSFLSWAVMSGVLDAFSYISPLRQMDLKNERLICMWFGGLMFSPIHRANYKLA